MVAAWRRGSFSATTARVLRIMALRIGGLARLSGRHIGGPEFLWGLEDAGFEQSQEIVEFGEIVLHRGRGQQQKETLVESVHQLVALARAVTQVMRLVDDDEIEVACQQALGVLAAARLRDRCDHALLSPERTGVVAQQRVMGGGARNIE